MCPFPTQLKLVRMTKLARRKGPETDKQSFRLLPRPRDHLAANGRIRLPSDSRRVTYRALADWPCRPTSPAAIDCGGTPRPAREQTISAPDIPPFRPSPDIVSGSRRVRSTSPDSSGHIGLGGYPDRHANEIVGENGKSWLLWYNVCIGCFVHGAAPHPLNAAGSIGKPPGPSSPSTTPVPARRPSTRIIIHSCSSLRWPRNASGPIHAVHQRADPDISLSLRRRAPPARRGQVQ